MNRIENPIKVSALLTLLVSLIFSTSCSQSPGRSNSESAREELVQQILSAMTVEEKASMLHGGVDPSPEVGLNGAGYVSGVPRLNIPPLRLADGPAGMRTSMPATALPAPIGLAASFDTELAQRYGEVIGLEGKARNQDVLLSPMVNIIRVAVAGRNFETFGEDPLLASKIVAAEIKGIQSKGLMATVKHYIANNQENNRTSINAIVDERTLREMYLPGFEAAIDADVASFMCAYNQVNGSFACDNSELLNTLLRDDLNYDGFVMTDWWAGHSFKALENGLNLEMPGYEYPGINSPVVFSQRLIDSVNAGETDEALVDRALRPLLLQMQQYGFLDKVSFDGNQQIYDEKKPILKPDAENNIDVESNAKIALEVATKSAVMLKNENKALPLTEKDSENLLIIGPTARTTLIGGGGSSKVIPFRKDSPLAAIQELTKQSDNVSYTVGVDLDGEVLPETVLRPSLESTETGLSFESKGETEGEIVSETSITQGINFIGDRALSVKGNLLWRGILKVNSDGLYDFKIQVNSGRAQILIDGEVIANTHRGVLSQASLIPTQLNLINASGGIRLEAGRDYAIEVKASTDSNSVLETSADIRDKFEIRLAWSTPEIQQMNIAEAVKEAKKANAAVVFAYIEGTEGVDRNTLALPGYQNELISALAEQELNKLIVVLNVGAPITMPWENNVDAILQMWYPGQEGGKATASLLFGKDNPSGKLPVTFPNSDNENPTTSPLQYPGVDGRQEYSEGLYVGYRWFDKENINPLFAFGHGLSYSHFEYSDLIIKENENHFEVAVTVKNVSDKAGAETPQLYLGQSMQTDIDTEVQKLVDFDKIYLAPGAQSTIHMEIPPRALSYWNTDTKEWERITGERNVGVGSSSRDIRLNQTINIR